MKEEVINILTKRKKKEAKKKEKKNYYYCKLLAGQDIAPNSKLVKLLRSYNNYSIKR